MNLKTVMPLGLAIVLGLVAAFVAKNTLGKKSGPSDTASQVRILVAKKDIGPGKALTAEDVALAPVVGKSAPASALTDPALITGRAAGTAGIIQGQAIVEAVLAPQGSGAGLQSLIPTGMRAITIDVNETSGLAGMVQPGCMVDLMTTLHTSKGDGSVARTIVQNVKVTAVGARVNPNPTPEQQDQGPARSVTLLVNPKDAEIIELAASIARPRLVLRSNRDSRMNYSAGITLTDLVGGERNNDPFIQPVEVPQTSTQPAAQQVSAPSAPRTLEANTRTEEIPMRSVTIIRGGTESNIRFRLPARATGTITDTETGPAIPTDN